MFRIIFWGVRGSIPTPGPDTVSVGGNTTCVEVKLDNELIVFDGGTGMRLFGESLDDQESVQARIFFSHVHWDHIQGFPFFRPAFIKGNSFDLYGGGNFTRTLEETLLGQMNFPNFPVTLDTMVGEMHFHDVDTNKPVVFSNPDGDVMVTPVPLNHPNGCFGYRVDYHEKSMVFATDTEHFVKPDPNLLRVCKDADILIYDAQYTPEEYAGYPGYLSKTGWGHSTFAEGAKLSSIANVKRLVLTHHDPSQDDAAVMEKERRCQELLENSEAAREGLVIDLE